MTPAIIIDSCNQYLDLHPCIPLCSHNQVSWNAEYAAYPNPNPFPCQVTQWYRQLPPPSNKFEHNGMPLFISWKPRLPGWKPRLTDTLTWCHASTQHLAALQQLVHKVQRLLEICLPCENLLTPLQPHNNLPSTKTVLIPMAKTLTPCPVHTSQNLLSLTPSPVPKIAQYSVLPSIVSLSQKPCAIPHPPHNQTPYKICIFAKHSHNSRSHLSKTMTCQTKDIFKPP